MYRESCAYMHACSSLFLLLSLRTPAHILILSLIKKTSTEQRKNTYKYVLAPQVKGAGLKAVDGTYYVSSDALPNGGMKHYPYFCVQEGCKKSIFNQVSAGRSIVQYSYLV